MVRVFNCCGRGGRESGSASRAGRRSRGGRARQVERQIAKVAQLVARRRVKSDNRSDFRNVRGRRRGCRVAQFVARSGVLRDKRESLSSCLLKVGSERLVKRQMTKVSPIVSREWVLRDWERDKSQKSHFLTHGDGFCATTCATSEGRQPECDG